MKHPVLFAALFGAASLLAGCVTSVSPPYPPVPPLQAETIPNPPISPTPLIWQPGHWNWSGSGYVWAPGMFVPQGNHSNMFMPGHWQQAGGGWVWQPAHWL